MEIPAYDSRRSIRLARWIHEQTTTIIPRMGRLGSLREALRLQSEDHSEKGGKNAGDMDELHFLFFQLLFKIPCWRGPSI
jgi:hypothetical protein